MLNLLTLMEADYCLRTIDITNSLPIIGECLLPDNDAFWCKCFTKIRTYGDILSINFDSRGGFTYFLTEHMGFHFTNSNVRIFSVGCDNAPFIIIQNNLEYVVWDKNNHDKFVIIPKRDTISILCGAFTYNISTNAKHIGLKLEISIDCDGGLFE